MTGTPDGLIERPDSDPLSALLGSVRLSGGLFLEAHFTAPWCISSQVEPEDCRAFMKPPVQIISYHVVIEGRLLVGMGDGLDPMEVNAGEIVLLPRNDGHTLGSAPGLPAINAHEVIQPQGRGRLAKIVHGGGGESTRLVCGFLGGEDARNPLISSLPPLLKIDVREAASREWIEASVRFAARSLAEGRFGSSDVISRLSESLLVEAVRGYADSLSEEEAGWLRGARDPHVGQALALLHGEPEKPWTADTISRRVGLSRTVFNERFARLVGRSPIRYLTHWRLQLARARLRDGQGSIAQIAHAVGYESEEAFNRAFAREFGEPPARWRRLNRPAG
jgi:AraC-like DNA-binding protein